MELQQITEMVLQQLKKVGFEQARVLLKYTEKDELCIAHNKASLLRSCEDINLFLMGIFEQRRASSSLTKLDEKSIQNAVNDLFSEAQSSPIDKANQVSSGQIADITKGPQQADLKMLVNTAKALLAFRDTHTPYMCLEESSIQYVLEKSLLVTSEGTKLSDSIGYYSMSVFGPAKRDGNTSSFNYTGGRADSLTEKPVEQYFAIGEMMQETSLQVINKPLLQGFTGEVLLTANAVSDLLNWLISQVSDISLLKGTSIFSDKVNRNVASPLLTVSSNSEASGAATFSLDGFALQQIALIHKGVLQCLLPSLYASRQLGIKHVAKGNAWKIEAGESSKSDMLKSIKKGALVGRLSMGYPSPNGDFSGVIKNSFLIEDGVKKHALSEVMISGNIAQMLLDISAVSREVVDCELNSLPCLQISNLQFS